MAKPATPSYFFFDFESFGSNARVDRASQFAGIRTDEAFNEIEDPVLLYCRPANDFLPSIEACLITGITPQIALQKGVPETEFFGVIQAEMMRPITCNLGFNSINFDDEMVRHGFYRNFIDPYEREWKNGNSRFDVLNLVRAVYALRPEGLQWPTNAEGRIELKLERLTKANSIAHEGAHDALSDVRATIGLMKLIKSAQPRLVDFLLGLRDKNTVADMLEFGKPIIHVSPFYSVERNYFSVVVPVAKKPGNTNSYIAYDLSLDPADFLGMSPEEIKNSVFSKKTEGVIKIPLVEIQTNRCPALAPMSAIRKEDANRLGLDPDRLRRHATAIQESLQAFRRNVEAAYAGNSFGEPETDPDLLLYGGAFFNASDKQQFAMIRRSSGAALAQKVDSIAPSFHDPRGPEMLFRYRARNYPESLSPNEQVKWDQYRLGRIAQLSPDYQSKLVEALAKAGLSERDKGILTALKAYEDVIAPGHKNVARETNDSQPTF